MQATSKEKCSNLRARRIPRPVWIGPNLQHAYLSPVPGVHHEGEVRRQGPVVRCLGFIVVLVRLRELVGQLAGPHEHLPFIVWSVQHLYLCVQ